MKKVILCLILIISTLSPYVSANNELTHEDMIRLYGDGYADSFLGTVVEANAKMSVNEAENREMIDSWISNNLDYLKGRAKSYIGSMQGAPEGANFAEKMLHGYGGLFKEIAIGTITLAEGGWDFLTSLFGKNSDGSDPYYNVSNSCMRLSVNQAYNSYDIFFTLDDCEYVFYNKTINATLTRIDYDVTKLSQGYLEGIALYYGSSYSAYTNGDYLNHIDLVKFNKYPVPSLDYVAAILGYMRNSGGYASKNWKLVHKSNLNEPSDQRAIIINHINNSTPAPVKIPILTPEANCPSGHRIIFADGLGGYVDVNGQPFDVSQCTIVWKQPVIDRDENGELQIDNGDGNGPQKLETDGGAVEEDGEGGLGSIAAIISALADAVKSLAGFVTELLDGLLGLFVPDDLDFVTDEINRITDELTSKISIVEDIKTMLTSMFVPTDVNPLSNISLDLPIVGKPISFGDLAFINQHVPTVRRVLGGFIWLITIVYVYRKIIGRGGVMEK